MEHKHDWQYAGRHYEILNEEAVKECERKFMRWLDKEYSFFSLLLFKSYPRPKQIYPEYEYYLRFVCECGKTKMVKQK